MNAISHWIWGTQAFRENAPSIGHTLTGYVIHHAASVWWGVWHAKAWGTRRQAKRPLPALAGGAAVAALACLVDYQMTPERLRPGFEHRLSTAAMVGVYACFALGLALGSLATAPAPRGRSAGRFRR